MSEAYVTLSSKEPEMKLTMRLIGKPYCTPPRPKTQIQARPLQKDLGLYVGHELREMELPVKLDNPGGQSVEGLIGRLYDFAERRRWAGRYEPPIIRAFGKTVPHTGLEWKLVDIEEDRARTLFQDDGDRYFYVATLRLREHSEDTVLPESLKAILSKGRSRGIVTRSTVVRAGETSLYDVARRVFRDPSRAGDIGRANPQIKWLGARLRQGQKIKLP